jgi:hypothetical protein
MGILSALRNAFGPSPVLHVPAATLPREIVLSKVEAPKGSAQAMLAALRANPELFSALRAYGVLADAGQVPSNGNGLKTRLEEPSVRSFVTWTPTQRRNAVIMADAGTMIWAADICEAMLGDDRIPAVLQTRANALIGTEIDFDEQRVRTKHQKLPKTLSKVVQAYEEDWWTIFPEDELRRLIVWGLFLGVAIAQLVWKTDPETGRIVPSIDVWHPRFLRFDFQKSKWFLKVNETLTEIEITPGDGKWILFTPYGARRPWSFGMWRGMSLMWLLKVFACRDWAMHSEIHGNPIRLGKLAPRENMELQKGTDAIRKDLLNDLVNIGNDTSIVLPAGFDLELVEATARTWQMFQAQIQMANTAFAVQAIGSNLPTEVGAKISTGATAATLVRNDYTASDGNAVTTTAREQVAPVWTKLNFGDSERAPWSKYMTDPPVDQANLSLVWQQVGNALSYMSQAGAIVTPEQLKEKFDIEIEIPEPEEEPDPNDDSNENDDGGAPDGGEPVPEPKPREDKGARLAMLMGVVQRYNFQGFAVSVENPAGSVRTWTDADGMVRGSTLMLQDYGFVEGHLGNDGEEIDVYIGPDESSAYAYVIHQRSVPMYDRHDEDKLVLGARSPDEAKDIFLRHRNDGERAFGGMTMIPVEELRKKLMRRGPEGRGRIRATALGAKGSGVKARAEAKAHRAHAAGDRAVDTSSAAIAEAMKPVVESIAKAAARAKGSVDPKRAFQKEMRAYAALPPPKSLIDAFASAAKRGAKIGEEHS